MWVINLHIEVVTHSMKLTELQIKQAKGKEKQYKLADGGGLTLLVKPKGNKYWQLRYRMYGKAKTLSIGVYPSVTLKQAREAREKAKKQLAENIDPSQQKQVNKLGNLERSANTFEVVGRLWIERKSHEWSETHIKDTTRSLEVNVFPFVGHIPITDITTPVLVGVLEKVQNRGSLETSKRLRQRCSGIFRYGIAAGLCESDPAEYLKDVLKKHKKQNLAALSPDEIPGYLDALDGGNMEVQTRLAIKLMMLTFVRNSELRCARWSEFDFDNAQWIIPAERMKKKDQGEHVVPLSKEAMEVLRQLQNISGHRELVFPQKRDPKRPMTDATITRVIHRIGYKGRMTVHGYRSVASTILNESSQFNPDAIERQLHHKESNAVRAAYNRAEYIEERTRMMQWWADWIVSCRNQGNVMYRKFA